MAVSPVSLTFGTGAGTGAAGSATGTDSEGTITVTTGTGPVGMAIVVTATFAQTYDVAPSAVDLTPANVNAAELGSGWCWPPNTLLAAASFQIKAPTQALAASTTYIWYFRVRM